MGPTVRSITELLLEKLGKWVIFDTYDHPASKYVAGRVCLAGDAAHASAPHHRAGAGIGVEDAFALCTLLEKLMKIPWASPEARAKAVAEAFIIYNDVRRERCEWLVNSSRNVCDIYEWIYPETRTDWDKCEAEITRRSHRLWCFDVEGILEELDERFKQINVN